MDETGLVAIFGWWSWACIAFAVVSFIAAIFVPIIPGKASAGALLLGIALGIAKGFIVKYVWTLYLGFGAGLLVFAIPVAVAGYRYLKAKLSGQPITGRALVSLSKGKSNARKAAPDSGGVCGGVVHPPETIPRRTD